MCSYLGSIFEAFVPPEGDGVASLLSGKVIIIITIIITKTVFMVLSSWQSHCKSSPG